MKRKRLIQIIICFVLIILIISVVLLKNKTESIITLDINPSIEINLDKNDIKWNFTKFIVDREGNVVGRYSPTYKPEDMESKISELL